MSKSFHYNPLIIFTLCVFLQVACHSTPSVGMETRQSSEDKTKLDQVRKQVELFAVGEGDEAVYSELQKLPRNSLIADLEKLRKQTDEDDALQVRIAFLLCRFNYHYEENREKIAWSLARNSPYYKLPPDEVIGFASNLISQGDTQLLRVVMAAAEWADGALSEGIADILGRAVMNNFDTFLKNLKSLTPVARQKIYTLLTLFPLNPKDKETIKRHLKANSKNKNFSKIAQEMMQALAKPL